MVIFRYSGSVYHTAILSEALYLVLLLKYPYYNEMKGSKFCILLSWRTFKYILINIKKTFNYVCFIF